jgi:5-methylthioribose kinase
MRIDIENFDALKEYLIDEELIFHNTEIHFHQLTGGVSNRTLLVEIDGVETWVIKQALEKLRVKADWYSEPARIHQEALALQWLPKITPQGTIPQYIFEDHDEHILIMVAVKRPHHNWKTLLLNGQLDLFHVQQFARLLADIHRNSAASPELYRQIFEERKYFEALRIEPYYVYTAAKQREAGYFYQNLIEETRSSALSLVHGDYSPKNILILENKLILLDHEVIHFGDPSFDVGFSMTHLISKAHHLPMHRQQFLKACKVYWDTYAQRVFAEDHLPQTIEARAVKHMLGCLLARVDGRSPLEYLDSNELAKQRAICLDLMQNPPNHIYEVIDAIAEKL